MTKQEVYAIAKDMQEENCFIEVRTSNGGVVGTIFGYLCEVEKNDTNLRLKDLNGTDCFIKLDCIQNIRGCNQKKPDRRYDVLQSGMTTRELIVRSISEFGPMTATKLVSHIRLILLKDRANKRIKLASVSSLVKKMVDENVLTRFHSQKLAPRGGWIYKVKG